MQYLHLYLCIAYEKCTKIYSLLRYLAPKGVAGIKINNCRRRPIDSDRSRRRRYIWHTAQLHHTSPLPHHGRTWLLRGIKTNFHIDLIPFFPLAIYRSRLVTLPMHFPITTKATATTSTVGTNNNNNINSGQHLHLTFIDIFAFLLIVLICISISILSVTHSFCFSINWLCVCV